MHNHELDTADGRGIHEPEEVHPTWRNILFFAVIIAVVLVFAGMAFAKSKTIVVNRGLICDTVEQLTAAVEGVRPMQSSFNEVEGCGHVVGMVRATITPLATYETEHATFLIGRLDFHNQIGTQYGYLGYTLKEPSSGA